MRVLVLLALASVSAAERTADEYFEFGIAYLRKGHYGTARAAFSESLVRAPGQPVTMAFLGVASAADGRPPAEAALLLRWAYERLPDGKRLRIDLRRRLPSARALTLLLHDLRRRAGKAKGPKRLDLLTVLAFLEVHDGDAKDAPALDLLLKERPKDRYALRLAELRSSKDVAS